MFTFKGISSTDMGVFIYEHFPIPVSVARQTDETIPGRDGVVSYEDGSYEGSEISGKVYIKPTTNLDAVVKWLQGWGELIIPGAPDRYFNAKLSNIVPINEFVRNEVYEVPLTFKCQPFGYLLTGKDKVEFKSGTITNPGNTKAKPYIYTNGGEVSITVNGRSFSTNAPLNHNILIDCELEEVVDLTDEKFVSSTGEFPYFEEGDNVVTCSGNMQIIYNWRML